MEGVFEVAVSNVTREGTFIGEVFMRTSYAKVSGGWSSTGCSVCVRVRVCGEHCVSTVTIGLLYTGAPRPHSLQGSPREPGYTTCQYLLQCFPSEQ